MRLAYAFLAEAADAANGRFFVFGGGLELVQCLALPTMLPSLAVVVKLCLDLDDRESAHMVRIRATPPEGGQPIPDLDAPFGPLAVGVPEDRAVYHLVIANYRGLPISQYGEYRFGIYVDDVELGSLTFLAEPSSVQLGQNPQTNSA